MTLMWSHCNGNQTTSGICQPDSPPSGCHFTWLSSKWMPLYPILLPILLQVDATLPDSPPSECHFTWLSSKWMPLYLILLQMNATLSDSPPGGCHYLILLQVGATLPDSPPSQYQLTWFSFKWMPLYLVLLQVDATLPDSVPSGCHFTWFSSKWMPLYLILLQVDATLPDSVPSGCHFTWFSSKWVPLYLVLLQVGANLPDSPPSGCHFVGSQTWRVLPPVCPQHQWACGHPGPPPASELHGYSGWCSTWWKGSRSSKKNILTYQLIGSLVDGAVISRSILFKLNIIYKMQKNP